MASVLCSYPMLVSPALQIHCQRLARSLVHTNIFSAECSSEVMVKFAFDRDASRRLSKTDKTRQDLVGHSSTFKHAVTTNCWSISWSFLTLLTAVTILMTLPVIISAVIIPAGLFASIIRTVPPLTHLKSATFGQMLTSENSMI